MKVVILGLGISGKAAALYLQKRGDEILGVDRVPTCIENLHFVSDSSPAHLKGVDLVVKSPGIPSNHPWIVAADAENIPIIGEVDLAFAELFRKNKRVFGITGSNGKTTTTLLTAHLLNIDGQKAVAAGNVGIPLISQIETDADVFVVELSSFQLENCVENQVLDGAVILNMTPNHLDRHPSFEHYCAAKLRIFGCLKKQAPLFVSSQVSKLCTHPHEILENFKKKIESTLSLEYREHLYPHDFENICAAFALTSVSLDTLKRGVSTFIKPPHRLEWIRTVSGVHYINDSKATSVDAVIKAVQAIPGSIILIAGGVDKGGAFYDWLPYFRGKVIRVLATGSASNRLIKELGSEIVVDQISSLEVGINMASQLATAGDTVLLSPGCSSYDQFKDYQERGEVFRRCVNNL